MAPWARFLANPKLFKRFMRTKAGRKAAWRWGTMLVQSKTFRDLLKKGFDKYGESKQFVAYKKKFDELQAKVAKIESDLDVGAATDEELQAVTFTLGRQVIEMRRLYDDMQRKIQEMQSLVMAQQHTR